jgi:hypothetical protein
MFSTLCTIEADTSQISETLEPHRSRMALAGRQRIVQTYYRMQFDIILSFGLTELKAQIAWMEDVGPSYRFSHLDKNNIYSITRARRRGMSATPQLMFNANLDSEVQRTLFTSPTSQCMTSRAEKPRQPRRHTRYAFHCDSTFFTFSSPIARNQ